MFDARGRIVTPGLIDVHAHVYDRGIPVSIDPDRSRAADRRDHDRRRRIGRRLDLRRLPRPRHRAGGDPCLRAAQHRHDRPGGHQRALSRSEAGRPAGGNPHHRTAPRPDPRDQGAHQRPAARGRPRRRRARPGPSGRRCHRPAVDAALDTRAGTARAAEVRRHPDPPVQPAAARPDARRQRPNPAADPGVEGPWRLHRLRAWQPLEMGDRGSSRHGRISPTESRPTCTWGTSHRAASSTTW